MPVSNKQKAAILAVNGSYIKNHYCPFKNKRFLTANASFPENRTQATNPVDN
jgi:hypothetical protein